MQEFIKETVKYLKQGKTILYPTDTVWGIGCDATNAKAVDKVYKLKRRAESKSLIILVDSEYSLNGYMKEVPAVAYDLIESIDKPLTIIYPNARNLAKNVKKIVSRIKEIIDREIIHYLADQKAMKLIVPLIEILKTIEEKYSQKKIDYNAFDFSDLEEKAIELLISNDLLIEKQKG